MDDRWTRGRFLDGSGRWRRIRCPHVVYLPLNLSALSWHYADYFDSRDFGLHLPDISRPSPWGRSIQLVQQSGHSHLKFPAIDGRKISGQTYFKPPVRRRAFGAAMGAADLKRGFGLAPCPARCSRSRRGFRRRSLRRIALPRIAPQKIQFIFGRARFPNPPIPPRWPSPWRAPRPAAATRPTPRRAEYPADRSAHPPAHQPAG